jgi:hypothetical protein
MNGYITHPLPRPLGMEWPIVAKTLSFPTSRNECLLLIENNFPIASSPFDKGVKEGTV